MLIEKVRLENIRSFVEQEVVFHDGVTLLAGDIGSGKSTILLAVDFALFGIRRGELDGSTLLRHGKDRGSIELTFRLEQKQVIVKRTLKRGAAGVVQDFGFISIDGKGREATAVELKQCVIDLFRYPQEMLTKKSLIYRFTVYTPQEEMKLILQGGKEERLETLRKVFDIDKYKRIMENARIVAGRVREQRKVIAGKVYDYEEKKKRLGEQEARLSHVKVQVESVEREFAQARGVVQAKEQEVRQFEEKYKLFVDVQKQQGIAEVRVAHARQRLKSMEEQARLVQEDLARLGAGMQERPSLTIKTEIHSYEEIIRNAEQALRGVVLKMQEAQTKKAHSHGVQESIARLDVCPTCKQQVSVVHKQEIHAREEEVMQGLYVQLGALVREEEQASEQIARWKHELELLREKERQLAVFLVQHAEWERKKEAQTRLVTEREAFVQEVAGSEAQLKTLAEQARILESVVQERSAVVAAYEQMRKVLQESEVRRSAFVQELRVIEQEHVLLQKEVNEKEVLLTKMRQQEKMQAWLEDEFVLLVQEMERNVLLRVHKDLDELFRSWFERLIEGENIQVRLDESFTPVIEQNGYDTTFENLSGGEKTAAALAYRLALNQVINNLASSLNTKDLIILDEPTDGFSSQQIEKMRDLLRELKVRQIIVVSHEQQVENFVDHIIRLEKEGHVSAVAVLKAA